MTKPAVKDVGYTCEVEEPTLHELEDKPSVDSCQKIRSSTSHTATEAEGLPMDPGP